MAIRTTTTPMSVSNNASGMPAGGLDAFTVLRTDFCPGKAAKTLIGIAAVLSDLYDLEAGSKYEK